MRFMHLASVIATLLLLGRANTVTADQILYLASTQAKTVVGMSVDPATGKLDDRFRIELPGNLGPMAFSPDKSMVYAALTGLEGNKAGVSSLKRAKDGTLKLVKTAFIKSRAPYINVSRDGNYLLAAHYGAGEVTTYRIADGVCTGELLDHKVTAKTAHCIEIDPSGKFVFVPHTSPNKVYQFVLDAKTGKLNPNDPPFVTGPEEGHMYHQPRHYAHHPTLNMAYTSNERGGGITAYKFDTKRGTLTKQQTLSTLPADYEGNSAAADIKITPNGRFAYVSNRDVTNRPDGKHRDTLCAVSLDAKTGKMKIIGQFATAAFPRSFCIDVDGKYLYAAGQRSATLVAYRINQDTGELKQLAEYKTGGVPIWVMCAKASD